MSLFLSGAALAAHRVAGRIRAHGLARTPSPGPGVLLAPMLACAAGDGMRFEIINMERPPEGLGLAPPPDYGPCYWGEARGYDRTGDGRIDEVRVMFKGRERCYGEDTNHDGVIDTWELADEHGEIVKRAQHVQGDGGLNDGATFDHVR